MEQIVVVGNYLVHLLKCAVSGEQPMEKPEGITYEEIYELAKRHNVESMAFCMVQDQFQGQLSEKWMQAMDRNILKSILQDEAEKELVFALTKADIKVVPLKGAIIKHLYP